MQRTRVLLNRRFFAFWLGQTFASFSDALMFIALPFIIFDATGGTNERVLAVAFTFGSLPRLSAFVIGGFIDRLPLKSLLIATGICRAGVILALSALVFQGHVSEVVIYAVAFFNGLLAVFVQTAGNVLLPEIVTANYLVKANSLMQIAYNGVPIAGYGLAGLLVASAGGGPTLLIAGLCFLTLPLCVSFIRVAPRKPSYTSPIEKDLLSGLKLLLSNRLLILASFASLLLNASVMLLNILVPGTMQDLGWGARGYGIFETLFGVGAMVGILAVATTLSSYRLTEQISISLLSGFVSFFLYAIGSSGWLYLAGSLFLGFAGGVASVSIITLFQTSTTHENRGRVIGGYRSIDALGFVVAPPLTGWLAPTLGNRFLYAACAFSVTLLLMAFLRNRKLQVGMPEPPSEPSSSNTSTNPKFDAPPQMMGTVKP